MSQPAAVSSGQAADPAIIGGYVKNKGDLISEIEKARGLSVKNDPRMLDAEKQLEAFRLKVADGRTRADGLKADLERKERGIAEQVLKGGSLSATPLIQLRQNLAAVEDEARILATVVEQAEAAAAMVKREVAREHTETNYTLLALTLMEFLDALKLALTKIDTLRAAASLPNLSRSNFVIFGILRRDGPIYSLQEANRIFKRYAENMQEGLRRIAAGTFGEDSSPEAGNKDEVSAL